MNTAKRFALSAALSVLLAGCTTTGTGGGQLAVAGAQDQPVAFTWTSTDGGISGSMTAILPGQTFQGRFFQITQQTRGEVLTPLWLHWRHGWHDWPYWGHPGGLPYATTQFITHYSGKVVATLESPDKQRMRCRFHMVDPARGMSGGGEGQCQLSDDRTVRASFAGK
ncbi:hypothetical protein [Rhodoferax sp.]|uniref:hypothetical protein n=1 Tax=Rhodoferax sp. TaxID=50421 RepID=UPI002757C623|nr:hypothetical protein [Rhodoferax sp.]